MGYGFIATESDKLILHGGYTGSFYKQLQKSDLWMLQLRAKVDKVPLPYTLIQWDVKVGGWSKLVHLGFETVCLLHPWLPKETQMMMINFDTMLASTPKVSGLNNGVVIRRNGFGIAGIQNSSTFVVIVWLKVGLWWI